MRYISILSSIITTKLTLPLKQHQQHKISTFITTIVKRYGAISPNQPSGCPQTSKLVRPELYNSANTPPLLSAFGLDFWQFRP